MGGCISITVRTIEGKEHRMCRWTNSLPKFVNNTKLIDKDEDHLQEYLKVWEDMSDAYNSGDTKDMPMADVYVPNSGLYPVEYGLVLIDYQTNTILTSQNYCNIGSLGSSEAGIALMGRHRQSPFMVSDDGEKEVNDIERDRVSNLFKSNRIKEVVLRDWSIKDSDGLTIEEFSKYGSGYEYALLDMGLWTIKNYLSGEIVKMLSDIIEMGFVLSNEETDGWNRFMDDEDI